MLNSLLTVAKLLAAVPFLKDDLSPSLTYIVARSFSLISFQVSILQDLDLVT